MVQRFKPDDDLHKDHHRRPKTGQKTVLLQFPSQHKPDGKNRRNHESNKITKKSASSFKLCDVGSDLKGFELSKPSSKKTTNIDIKDVDGLVSLPSYMENDHHLNPSKSLKSQVFTDLPNYMKPTRSSGAKKKSKNSKTDQSGRCLLKMSSLKLARNLTKSSSSKQVNFLNKKRKNVSVITNSKDTRVQKPTCSSLLKDAKFPSHVKIEAGGSEANGASSMKVCSYKYCSLNGHCHTNPQPLKSFISHRRHALKQQENLKLDEDDGSKRVPFRGRNEMEEEELEDFLGTGIEVESDEELYETIWEAYMKEIQEFEYIEAQMEEEVYIKIKIEEDFDCISENSFKGSVALTDDDVADICNGYNSQCQNSERIDETVISYVEEIIDKEMVFAEDETTKENAEDDQIENKFQMDQNELMCTAAKGECEISETGMMLSGIKITKGKGGGGGGVEEESENEKEFNPQEPNYLPLEKGPKSEQVDLKHQDMDERKNSEEWMVDYALRKTVNKLAPVKRKKVELLVEAFESVAPYQT